jgi:hypothetical protein
MHVFKHPIWSGDEIDQRYRERLYGNMHVPYSLRPKLSVAFDFRDISLTWFIKNIYDICISNKFIKKIDSKIFPMLPIMYHKY